MKYNAPYGSADQNASFVNGSPTSRGSVIPAGAIEDPQREIVNAIIALGLTPSTSDKSQLAKGLLAQSLAYSATVDYTSPRVVIGSDNNLYVWKQANGPSTTVVNPVNDTTSTYWVQYAPNPPDATSLAAGLVKLSDALDGTEDADTGQTAATPAAVKTIHDIIVNLEVVLAEFQRQLIVESDVITRYQINTNEVLRYLLSKIDNMGAGSALITTPSITSPASGSVLTLGESLSLTSSAFSCAISASHNVTDWKICDDKYGSSIVAQVSASSTNKTSVTFASTAFESITKSKDLYAFVRYNDSSLGYSFWSSPVKIHFDALDESEGESEGESGEESEGESL